VWRSHGRTSRMDWDFREPFAKCRGFSALTISPSDLPATMDVPLARTDVVFAKVGRPAASLRGFPRRLLGFLGAIPPLEAFFSSQPGQKFRGWPRTPVRAEKDPVAKKVGRFWRSVAENPL
jgi:hypothetical protein